MNTQQGGKETMDGLLSGYQIDVTNANGEKFEIKTVGGVRGIDIPVVVMVEDGKWSATLNDRPIEIREVKKVTKVG